MTSLLVAAAVQLSSQADVQENLARAENWIAEAARAGAQLVALPENFAFMGEEADKRRIAESLTPPFGPIASAVARGIWADVHGGARLWPLARCLNRSALNIPGPPS